MPEQTKHDINIHEQMGPMWQFNQPVADVFDEMLERSIPQYSLMRTLVTDVASAFRQQETDILDLGTSRGEAIKPLIDLYGSSNKYIAVESAPAMVSVFRERYAPLIDSGLVRLLELDLREKVPSCRASVVMSILTLMFVPINHRQRIIADVFQALVPGGAFILVEKVLGEGRLNDLMIDRYHAVKEHNGYSREEISRKALALEGVQVPLTASWNEQMLRSAGFAVVDCFWRCWNFAGWVAVKEPDGVRMPDASALFQ
jgi:tRNA (cmo5U34)-methyltransferase